jgi:hypothetical protein
MSALAAPHIPRFQNAAPYLCSFPAIPPAMTTQHRRHHTLKHLWLDSTGLSVTDAALRNSLLYSGISRPLI